MSYAEAYARYSWYMAVLNMTREQIEANENAAAALAEIIGYINEEPDDPIWTGIRPQVEKILGPQQWAKGSAA